MEQVVSPELSQPIASLPVTASLAPEEIDAAFSTSTIDLISAPLLPRILSLTDEFFAAASNLLTPTPPISRPGVFVASGAWYDGWETRRHNRAPSDDVVIRLGPAAGIVRGIEIDTAFFTGNHAPAVSVEGAYEVGPGADEKVVGEGYSGWGSVLSKCECGPGRRHAWFVDAGEGVGAGEGGEEKKITHVRLRIYPDGGVARFRVYGRAVPVWDDGSDSAKEVELSAAVNGGIATAWSDAHYGKPVNLLLPGRGKDMGDGWETKRSRGAGHEDWAVVRLGARGKVQRVVVDTMHFRGNFPREVRVELGDFRGEDGEGRMEVEGKEEGWVTVAARAELKPDTEFEFKVGDGLEGVEGREWTHAKLTMVPDGGVKRFRVFGTKA